MFGKKSDEFNIKDIIWLTENAKFNALANEVVKQPDSIVIAWFEQTYEKLGPFFTTSIFLAREVTFHLAENKKVLFAEHYPLANKEAELFEKLKLHDVVVYTSLDEPIIKHFSGDEFQQRMVKLGMTENEPVTHSLISASIKNLQKKLAKKITVEQSARSQADWLLRNLPK